MGQKTKDRASLRPDVIHKELWANISKEKRAMLTKKWAPVVNERNRVRKLRGGAMGNPIGLTSELMIY